MTSVNTRGRVISWKGSLCLQGWDPLDVFVTLIKELRDGFTSSVVPMGEHTGWLYTMLYIQIKREKVNQLSRCFLILHECSLSGDLVLDNNVFFLQNGGEKHSWKEGRGCFPNTLLCFLFLFEFNNIKQNMETEDRQKREAKERPLSSNYTGCSRLE